MPGVAADQAFAGAGRVGLDAAGAEEDRHAFGAQELDAAAERGAAGQGGVDEGQHDGRDAEAGGLGEDA
jgi:hypothetical protein